MGKDPKKKLEIKESPDRGVFIKDVSMVVTKTVDDINRALDTGSKNKSTGETLMNKTSSRSHCIFSIYVETQDNQDKDKIKVGKLNLVDLAGSER